MPRETNKLSATKVAKLGWLSRVRFLFLRAPMDIRFKMILKTSHRDPPGLIPGG
jgi:hypothetical protein